MTFPVCLLPTGLAGLLLFLTASAASGQMLSAEQILQHKDNWDQWAADDKKIQITGRYQSGVGHHFQLERLDIRFNTVRGARLPDRMEANQRLTVSGRLKKANDRFEFEISRLLVGDTDRRRLASQAAAVPDSAVDRLYALASEFAPIAAYYNDAGLQSEVNAVLQRAVAMQRQTFAKDAEKLSELADRASELGVAPATILAIRFQSLVVRTAADSFDRQAVLDDMRKHLPGWDDSTATVSSDLEQAFLKAPSRTFDEASDDERRQLHRRLYRRVRLPQFERLLEADGSNGLTLAMELRAELPEETDRAADFERAFLAFKLSQVTRLNRRQLQELHDLLLQHERDEDFQKALNDWLTAQRDQFEGRGLSGLMRVADGHLFAFEHWQNPQHRQQGVELLKRAWELAADTDPKEREDIAQRLERFGWTRMHDRWMTADDVRRLPRSDVDLAMREGRVVRGMSPAQVTQTLGEPGRTVRVVSSRYVQEVWVFRASAGSGVSVVMRRLRTQAPEDATVFAVTRTGH